MKLKKAASCKDTAFLINSLSGYCNNRSLSPSHFSRPPCATPPPTDTPLSTIHAWIPDCNQKPKRKVFGNRTFQTHIAWRQPRLYAWFPVNSKVLPASNRFRQLPVQCLLLNQTRYFLLLFHPPQSQIASGEQAWREPYWYNQKHLVSCMDAESDP